MSLSVAVVILNYNGSKLLQQFLPSVLSSTYTFATIYVVDNGSTDDSISVMNQFFPQVMLINLSSNLGFAKGYNEALKKIDADIYVLLNSDVEVTPGWIEPVVAMYQQNPKLGVAQPKILNQINKNKFDYAGGAGGFIDKFGFPFAKGRVFDTIETDEGQYNQSAEVFWASGCAMFVRSKLYHALDGLDEYFFAHQEEIDFCWRVQLSGYKLWACNDSVVYHVGGATLAVGSPQKTYLNFRNNLIMLYKNLSGFQKWYVLLVRLLLNKVAAAKFLAGGQFKHAWAVFRSSFAVFKWRFTAYKPHQLKKMPISSLKGVLKKNILLQYYIKGKKTYTDLLK